MVMCKSIINFRLDAISRDAELQEKSETDLKRLAELLKERCENAMTEHKEKLEENPNFEGQFLNDLKLEAVSPLLFCFAVIY